MKKNRDVKFIIYQSLYIFIISVVAIKGANLDLTQVIEDDGKPKVVMTQDSLDKLMKQLNISIIVDTSKYAIVDKKLLIDNEKLKLAVEQTKVDLSQYVLKTEVPKIEPKIEDKIEPEKIEKEIVIGNVELYQYHNNQVNNQGDNAITINGTTIAPHSVGKVLLGGESTTIIKAGDKTKTVAVKENKKPTISFQRMTAMGEDAKVTTLQRNICYRVTINDDFPDQLDIKFGSGVTVKQVSANVFDITMNAFSSKAAFDNYTENKSAPYNLGFTVSVKDRIAPHSVTGQNTFTFGDW